jgi:DNA-directed RNA polymerase subunit beta
VLSPWRPILRLRTQIPLTPALLSSAHPSSNYGEQSGRSGTRWSHEVLEGGILAVSRQSKSAVAATSSSVPGAPNRISFAKLREPLEVPGLLDVQTESFEWLIGAPRWREIALARGDVNPVGGLEEVLAELSPIEDFSGSRSLSFSDPRFDEVKAPVDECKDKDMTYAAPR